VDLARRQDSAEAIQRGGEPLLLAGLAVPRQQITAAAYEGDGLARRDHVVPWRQLHEGPASEVDDGRATTWVERNKPRQVVR
jgi:hypothetical protein